MMLIIHNLQHRNNPCSVDSVAPILWPVVAATGRLVKIPVSFIQTGRLSRPQRSVSACFPPDGVSEVKVVERRSCLMSDVMGSEGPRLVQTGRLGAQGRTVRLL